MLTMEFAADFRNVDIARAALQGICAECFATDRERADDMVMAVNEAMNNAVEHGATQAVGLEVAWSHDELKVVVISGGRLFDPVAAAAALDQEDMLQRDEGGYGIYLIRELIDVFSYEYRDSLNFWTLRKSTNPKV